MSPSGKDWKEYSHLFRRQEVKAKTTLLEEGQVSNQAWYIEKGCVRSWFNSNGKDITFQFFFEGEGVSSVESFRTNQPSLFTIETIEPCTLMNISKKDFQYILGHSASIREQVEEETFKRLVFYQRLFLSRIKNNPKERYEELIEQRPMILQRVPQHYIASYLGVTAVSLSRIRNRR